VTAEKVKVVRKRKAEVADLEPWEGKEVDLQEKIAASWPG
jgi:hypothetical protein